MAFVNFIVEPSWLHQKYESDPQGIRVIDGTWLMPGAEDNLIQGNIEGACFFDLDAVASPHANLKHMLPSAEQFEAFNRQHGINNDDHIICYDRHGTRTSPRLWWTYRMFGHEKVSVLNGGLPAWKAKGFETFTNFQQNQEPSEYQAKGPLSGVIGFEELKALLDKAPQIVDARPEGRFLGTTPEPRPGLISGRIPGSISLPFSDMMGDGSLSNMPRYADMIGSAGINLDAPVITTCGSGFTAAGLALIFHQFGAQDVRVYDASWAEWGASDGPIEV